MRKLTQFEVTIGVVITASDVEEALEIAEQSVGDNATVMTLQVADRSLLAPAKARETAARAALAQESKKP